MNKEEREAAIAYIKGYKKLDEDLHNTAPKDSVSYYATDKCLKYWDMAIQALEKENIYDDKEHYVTISKALYDKLNIDYEQALSQEPCDDTISREAVIMECIKYADHEYNVQLKKEVSETRKHDAQVIIYACDYFKTFVEKLPSVTPKPIECDDAVSRQAVRHILNHEVKMPIKVWKKLFELVDCLPSVTQKCEKCAMNGSGSKYCDNCGQKSGKWILTIEDWNKWACSNCGYVKRTDIHVNIGWKYCPNCGSYNGGDNNGNE